MRQHPAHDDVGARVARMKPMSASLLALVAPTFRSLASVLGAEVVERDGLLSTKAGALDVVVSHDGLSCGPLSMDFTAYERVTAADRVASFASSLRLLSSPARGLVTALTLSKWLKARGSKPGVTVELRERSFAFVETRNGWVSSYEYGMSTEVLAVLAGSGLPKVDAVAHALVDGLALLLVEPERPVSTGGTCTYCGGHFEAHEFLSNDRACHGCATSKLGVVF